MRGSKLNPLLDRNEIAVHIKRSVYACNLAAGVALTRTRNTRTIKEALATLGLELRNDSRLCAEFIDGSTHFVPTEIAEEMAAMHWLHNYTNYRTDAEELAREEIGT